MILKIEPIIKKETHSDKRLFIEDKISYYNNCEVSLISDYQKKKTSPFETKKLWSIYYEENKEQFDNCKFENFPFSIKIIKPISKEEKQNEITSLSKEDYKKKGDKGQIWHFYGKEIDNQNEGECKVRSLLTNMYPNTKMGINSNPFFEKENLEFKSKFNNSSPEEIFAIKMNNVLYEIESTISNNEKEKITKEKNKKIIHFCNTDFENFNTNKKKIEITPIIKNEFYNLKKIILNGKKTHTFKKENHFLIITVASGNLQINDLFVNPLESVFVSSEDLKKVKFNGKAILVVINPNW